MSHRYVPLLIVAIYLACSGRPSQPVPPRAAIGCFAFALVPPHSAASVPFLRGTLDLAAGPPSPGFVVYDVDRNYFGNAILKSPVDSTHYRGTWNAGGDSVTVEAGSTLMRLHLAGDSIAGGITMGAFGLANSVMKWGTLHGHRIACAA